MVVDYSQSSLDCEFCAEIRTGTIHGAPGENAPIAERFVARTECFVAFPSVSPLRLGHLLIVPHDHLTAAAHLNPDSRRELVELSERLAKAVSPSGEVACFEHGVGKSRTGGCGIDHAHLHLLPMTGCERDRALELVREEFPTDPSTELSHALANQPHDESYLYFGTLESVHAATADHIPSQFLRRCVARSIGNPIEDWRSLADWGVLEATHAELVA